MYKTQLQNMGGERKREPKNLLSNLFIVPTSIGADESKKRAFILTRKGLPLHWALTNTENEQRETVLVYSMVVLAQRERTMASSMAFLAPGQGPSTNRTTTTDRDRTVRLWSSSLSSAKDLFSP